MPDEQQKGGANTPRDIGGVPVPRPEELEELKMKCDEYLAGWKRALADYDNLKRDLGREREESRRRTVESLARGFLGVLEHFDQAMKHRPDTGACPPETQKSLSAWVKGVEHIRTAMAEELRSFGIEPLDPVLHTPYDPTLHETAGSRTEEGTEPGHILDIVSRGWKIGDKVIRPARVIISE